MRNRLTLALLVLVIMAGLTGAFADVKKKFVPANAVAGQKLSSRPTPAQITQESEEALTKKGYVRIGEISMEEVTGTYWGTEKPPETQPSRDLTTPLLLRAAEHGGDLVVLSRSNSRDSYQVMKKGKVLTWERQSRTETYQQRAKTGDPGVMASRTVYYSVPTSWETVEGKEFAVRSSGSVWRKDSDLARNVGPKVEAERQARAQREEAVAEIDRQALLLLQEAEGHAAAERQEAGIHDAALANDVETVRALLSKGAGANSKNATGDTPLHQAATGGAVDAAKLLLSKGADVNAEGFHGTAPLHYAAMANSKAVAEILLTHGADVNRKSGEGMTPMHGAAGYDAGDVALVLLANGADLGAKAVNGLTPLHMAAMRNARFVADLLLANGADVNAQADNGMTPLHVAASRNAGDVAGLLLAKGAKLDAKDKDGKTPFDLAFNGGFRELAALLLPGGTKR